VISLWSCRSSWDFKTYYTRTLIYSFVINEANVLEHIAPIYFPIYFIVVVLYARAIECAPMLDFTRIVLSFLETSESLVVIVGFKLLSLA
jgi:hypothetical protein